MLSGPGSMYLLRGGDKGQSAHEEKIALEITR